jgi:nicotinamide mononucleotide transporter
MLDFFLDAYRNVPIWHIVLEAVAFFTGIASVWLAKRENLLAYPIGLIGTAITSYLFWRAGYLGDMIVNGYYSLVSLFGWYNWARKKSGAELPVSRTTPREKIAGTALFFITIVVIFAVYKVCHQPVRPDNYIDIFLSGLFFAAMWYMALKKIENWTLWIVGDCIAVPLYAYRGLGMLSLQYVIFTVLAVQAYLAWKKNLSKLR